MSWGHLLLAAFANTSKWDDATISRFQAMADVFANALARKEADEKLQTAYAEIQQLKEQLEQENSYLRQEIKLEYGHKIVVGKSAGNARCPEEGRAGCGHRFYAS